MHELVVVGSSAGGIEALSTLLSTLPADFAAPIVIAQHLDPSRPSRLAEILARHSALPVRTVVDHEALQGGTVFVVPSNQHVEITDHTVSLRPGARGGPRPSIDRLFSSAAEAFGEHLIAVVLSGTGSDGASGARLVHEAGGTVLIQNPETASFPGMPRSLAPVTVDIVAELQSIGPTLQRLLDGTQARAGAEDQRTLQALLGHVRDRRGVDFRDYRQPTILRRLKRRLAATGSATLADYDRYLQDHPDEEDQLVASFLIKVTDFFRDPKTFAYLRDRVLPRLIAAARQRGAALRIWSAGTATGEEAYSLAVLVSDLLGDGPERIAVRIFATDLDAAAVAFARRGIYPAAALEHLTGDLVARYFTEANGEYEVDKAVRDLIVFGQHDLAKLPPFPRVDLVLCRNVLMYFTPELQQRVLQAFAFALRGDGYLVLGSAETASPLPEFFSTEQARLRIFRRAGGRVAFLPSQIDEAATQLPARLALEIRNGPPGPVRTLAPPPPGPPRDDQPGNAAAAVADRRGPAEAPLRHRGHQPHGPPPAGHPWTGGRRGFHPPAGEHRHPGAAGRGRRRLPG